VSEILFSDHGTLAIITLNRPNQQNCLTGSLMDELAEIVDSLRHSPRILTLIVAGAGGVFSAGADLSEVAALNPQTAHDFSRRGQSLLTSLGDAAPIVIAAIDGYCLGGGLDLALSCDLRYATPRSSFQHPGVKRGIITGWGGTQRLPRLIGVDATRRLLVSGNRIDAREAHRIGLINGVFDDALGHTFKLAARISDKFTREQLIQIKARV
jgi:enoyl-CoA hydratase